ncbi:hypothetical protein Y032_1070g3533 [Ancylostoma ceylanicum]|uniref:Uncharacterized protein n=1 Tax=Ancylostoma ceylanicum TaxID=53326 RepID=A0A016W6B1_9BILA|nr:hypothetical protein Y032_1070g3533 [Ancylostoma ceylanicum]
MRSGDNCEGTWRNFFRLSGVGAPRFWVHSQIPQASPTQKATSKPTSPGLLTKTAARTSPPKATNKPSAPGKPLSPTTQRTTSKVVGNSPSEQETTEMAEKAEAVTKEDGADTNVVNMPQQKPQNLGNYDTSDRTKADMFIFVIIALGTVIAICIIVPAVIYVIKHKKTDWKKKKSSRKPNAKTPQSPMK